MAVANYTESGGKGDPTYDTRQAIAIMQEKHGIACDMLHGSDWKKAVGDGKKTLFRLLALQEHIRCGERQRCSSIQPSGCRVGEATLGERSAGFFATLKGLQ